MEAINAALNLHRHSSRFAQNESLSCADVVAAAAAAAVAEMGNGIASELRAPGNYTH
jgi:hypothetical protein